MGDAHRAGQYDTIRIPAPSRPAAARTSRVA